MLTQYQVEILLRCYHFLHRVNNKGCIPLRLFSVIADGEKLPLKKAGNQYIYENNIRFPDIGSEIFSVMKLFDSATLMIVDGHSIVCHDFSYVRQLSIIKFGPILQELNLNIIVELHVADDVEGLYFPCARKIVTNSRLFSKVASCVDKHMVLYLAITDAQQMEFPRMFPNLIYFASKNRIINRQGRVLQEEEAFMEFKQLMSQYY